MEAKKDEKSEKQPKWVSDSPTFKQIDKSKIKKK